MASQIPFLNWAGGKRWLMHNFSTLFPTTFGRYFEPFLGSGASFFSLRPKRAILSDLNADLVNTYIQVKNHPRELVEKLKEHHVRHNNDYYYEIRAQILENEIDRAAQFLYLNRTCWNGLYRVNKNGIFNVPIGTKNNVILRTDNFLETSKALQGADLICGDFTVASKSATEGDFIYFDPPYTVKHNNNNFIKYNKKLFSWDDQIRLYETALTAKSSGAMVAVSNACHESIIKLYEEEFNIHILNRYSAISGKSEGRKGTEEVLMTSY